MIACVIEQRSNLCSQRIMSFAFQPGPYSASGKRCRHEAFIDCVGQNADLVSLDSKSSEVFWQKKVAQDEYPIRPSVDRSEQHYLPWIRSLEIIAISNMQEQARAREEGAQDR